MMGDYAKRLACRLKSPSMKLLIFIVPLMVVSVFITGLSPKIFSWDFVLWGNSNNNNNYYEFDVKNNITTSVGSVSSVSHAKESIMVAVESQSKVVVAAAAEGGGGGQSDQKEKEKVIVLSDDDKIGLVDDFSSNPEMPQVADMESQQLEVLDGSNSTSGNGLNSTSGNGTSVENFRVDNSIDMPVETEQPREFTSLEKLETGLQKARAVIREAKSGNQTKDPDYVPIGPMYWNAKVFHRSYLEMEKQFKVYVYEEGEHPVFHNGPCKSIYSMEGEFIHRMEIDSFRTKDPEKAHAFFLPFSIVMMVRFVYIRDSHDFGPIRRTVNDYINLVAGKYPFWNRSLGADHFMLACHDWGPEASFSHPYLGKNSIHALCNANTSEKFNPIKDVSIPEINLRTGSIQGLIGGPSASKRPILAFFAGGLHGPIRPILLKQWENKDPDIQVHQYLPKGVSYLETMRKTKFCLCPSGYEVASPRIVEAIYTGCVPVLISDHYIPPFSDVLNWRSFSVEVPVSEIPNLKKILTSISPRQYIRMQRRVMSIRRHFEVHNPPKRYDVFHMILHSIWLRRLNVRILEDEVAITR